MLILTSYCNSCLKLQLLCLLIQITIVLFYVTAVRHMNCYLHIGQRSTSHRQYCAHTCVVSRLFVLCVRRCPAVIIRVRAQQLMYTNCSGIRALDSRVPANAAIVTNKQYYTSVPYIM